MKYFLTLLLSFILISCGSGGEEKVIPNPLTLAPLTSSASYNQLLADVSPKIKDSPEFNSCMQSNIAMCAQSSVMQIAQRSKTPDFCKELSNEDQKESCKFAVIMTVVQEKGDVNLCDTLSVNFKRTCIIQAYRMKAMNTKDATLCSSIPLPEVMSGSIAVPTGMNDRGQCIMNVILSLPESKEADCKKIGDEALEKMCASSLKQRTPVPTSAIIPIPEKVKKIPIKK